MQRKVRTLQKAVKRQVEHYFGEANWAREPPFCSVGGRGARTPAQTPPVLSGRGRGGTMGYWGLLVVPRSRFLCCLGSCGRHLRVTRRSSVPLLLRLSNLAEELRVAAAQAVVHPPVPLLFSSVRPSRPMGGSVDAVTSNALTDLNARNTFDTSNCPNSPNLGDRGIERKVL